MSALLRAIAFTSCGFLLTPAELHAQTTTQLWGNLTLGWAKDERLVYELDVEPKTLLSAPTGDPGWWSLDVTPTVTYSLKGWLDLLAEVATGYAQQTDDVNSVELTPRVGATWHLLSRDIPAVVHVRELPPHRRVVIRDTMRVEQRNLLYSDATDDSHTVRFRNRVEFLLPLNTPKLSDDGARYVLADWEWFIPLDDAAERFANKQRIRAGVGYRQSHAWRFEALYIWNRSRNTIEDGFTTNDNVIDIRMKRLF